MGSTIVVEYHSQYMDAGRERTDEEVARRVQAGDGEAFGILMTRYEPKLLRYATRLLGDHDKGEEVVQETFIQAYRNIHAFNPSMRFSPWVYRIAHNQAINEIRRTERSPLALDLDTLIAFSSEENASDTAEEEETRRLIEVHLQKLPASYREILVLFYLQDLAYQEISDILHIPQSTVGVRLRRARTALKKLLDHSHE